MRRVIALWLVLGGVARSEPSPSPLPVLLAAPAPPSPLNPAFDLGALERSAKRNKLTGNLIIVGGDVLGVSSLALLLTSALRSCPAGHGDCNDQIAQASNWMGAAATILIGVGITVWAVGITQGRTAKRLRR